jgi:hypothetical protein
MVTAPVFSTPRSFFRRKRLRSHQVTELTKIFNTSPANVGSWAMA